MTEIILHNAVKMAQKLLLPELKQAKACLDATVGKGKDISFLAANSPANTVIWGFDIQAAAIISAQNLLTSAGLIRKTRLILDSHVNIEKYISGTIDVIMYNLGYLPGGSHDIFTQSDSTVASISASAKLLKREGIITIVAYPGFKAGKEEQLAVQTYLRTLPQKEFNVACWQLQNQVNNPPILYVIEKLL